MAEDDLENVGLNETSTVHKASFKTTIPAEKFLQGTDQSNSALAKTNKNWVVIKVGDTRDLVAALHSNSVETIVTSPPYYGHRDYGVDGQIGREPTPQAYIDNMVSVLCECRRVLRPDGTLWLNLGDAYAKRGGGQHKPKDLIGLPWAVAVALRDDGWYLRSEIIWEKPNAIPESVRDRPANCHEKIFLFGKSERYFFDAEAVKVPAKNAGKTLSLGPKSLSKGQAIGAGIAPSGNGLAATYTVKATKNLRNVWANDEDKYAELCRSNAANDNHMTDVWHISTKKFRGAHFATFPPDLVERCIKAGAPVGGTVFDPFGGAGTTALVANRLGRNAILFEINPDYARMAYERLIDSGIDKDTISVW